MPEHAIFSCSKTPPTSSNGRHLDTLVDAGTFSFQASKNMPAGDGGLTLTDDPQLKICNSYIWAGRKLGFKRYEHFRLGWNFSQQLCRSNSPPG
jgi:dTDP-4-amino-4,6-dideoxygalactose transaminase